MKMRRYFRAARRFLWCMIGMFGCAMLQAKGWAPDVSGVGIFLFAVPCAWYGWQTDGLEREILREEGENAKLEAVCGGKRGGTGA